MVLPTGRSFDSTISSPSFSRAAHGDAATANRMRVGSMLMLGTFFFFASVIAPLREWQFLDAQDHKRQTSFEASHGMSYPTNGDTDERTGVTFISKETQSMSTSIRVDKNKGDESYPKPLLSTPLSNATVESSHDDRQPTMNLKRNFSGIIARPFAPWPTNVPLPCYPNEDAQSAPATQGFFYLKPYKTGSSTTSGVNLRIARNVARRSNVKLCQTRFDHGPDFYAGHSLYAHRKPLESYLWTILRDPTTRAVSQFFHFEVSRKKQEPTDANFKEFLRQQHPIEDYYLRALYTKDRFSRDKVHPVKAANHILRSYNFIGITERLDESFVALMMLLNLKIADILHLSAKGRGGYDDAGGLKHQCTYIWPSFISPGMKEYFSHSNEWKSITKYDTLIYQAVNRSLDMTIDNLGREAFNENLAKFILAQEQAKIQCLPTTVFPCDSAGRLHRDSETDCLWKDSGCGSTCLDQLASELNLW